MLKRLIKSIPGAKSINSMLLQKKIQNQFLKLNETEQSHLAFYSQFIKKGDLVFDVGANVGSRSKLFLNLGAKVLAFEPQPELCEHLTQHLRLHKNFTLMPIGLGANPSVVELKISDAHVLSSMSNRWIESTTQSGRFSSYNWNKSIDVKVDTLDNMFTKFGVPRFVKIDVEGYELEVLKGLSRPVKHLSLEFTSEDIDNFKKCLNKIKETGKYIFQFSEGETLKFTFNEWMEEEKLLQTLESKIERQPLLWGDIYCKLEK
jgi:FkbM family methyltransferase